MEKTLKAKLIYIYIYISILLVMELQYHVAKSVTFHLSGRKEA